jgi:hypothetical protein
MPHRLQHQREQVAEFVVVVDDQDGKLLHGIGQ